MIDDAATLVAEKVLLFAPRGIKGTDALCARVLEELNTA
jgi:hypothetical protein